MHYCKLNPHSTRYIAAPPQADIPLNQTNVGKHLAFLDTKLETSRKCDSLVTVMFACPSDVTFAFRCLNAGEEWEEVDGDGRKGRHMTAVCGGYPADACHQWALIATVGHAEGPWSRTQAPGASSRLEACN
ncbi:hypothetical protein J6590_017726 [Homalodisca vitripennis]|nr:hypothetical protein J6590_017726 [Homalodisca vitripennis]